MPISAASFLLTFFSTEFEKKKFKMCIVTGVQKRRNLCLQRKNMPAENATVQSQCCPVTWRVCYGVFHSALDVLKIVLDIGPLIV